MTEDSKLSEVFRKIDDYRDASIETLADLIQIPSIAAQEKGIECADEILKIVEREIGFQTQKFESPGYPIIYAEQNVNAPTTIIFYNHYDVQPADPLEQWDSSPFTLDIRDEKLYGRGVSDDKGNLIARIFAVKAYQSIFKQLPINLKFIIEGEEESGSPNLPLFVEENPHLIRGNFCIWESGHRNHDGRQQIWLGVKGMLQLNLKVSGAKRDIHSSWGGVVDNPAWVLIWALNSLKDSHQNILIDGFYENVQTPSPDELENIKTIPFQEKEYEADFGIERFIQNGMDLKKAYYFSPTLTINGLTSGYQGPGSKTIIPATAQAKVEFRLVPNQTPTEILTKFKAHLHKNNLENIEITSHHGYIPTKTSFTSPYLKAISSAAEKVYGAPLIIHPNKAGSGPMYLFASQMDCFDLGCGHPNSHNHAPNENIFINDLLLNMKHLAAIFHQFSSKK